MVNISQHSDPPTVYPPRLDFFSFEGKLADCLKYPQCYRLKKKKKRNNHSVPWDESISEQDDYHDHETFFIMVFVLGCYSLEEEGAEYYLQSLSHW